MPATVIVELSVDAANSGDPLLQGVKKVLLEVAVRCPVPGCRTEQVSELETPGPSNAAQQSYQCQKCGHRFTWEQSGFVHDGRQYAWTALLEACVRDGRTETAVAAEIGVPQCHISRLVTTATQEIAQHEHHLKELVHRQAIAALTTQGLNPVVETDETFLSAQGRTFYPIWTVDQQGTLIHFDWLANRSDERLAQYLADQRIITGPTTIQAHDGYAGYHRWAQQDPGNQIEIIHIHRHPKGRVLLVAHERSPHCTCTARHILGLHTRSLHGPGPPIGYYAVHRTRCPTHSCLCAPNLCLDDDHLYLCDPCRTYPTQIQQEHRWQLNLPQEVFKKGMLVSWERPPQSGALPFLPHSNVNQLPEPFDFWSYNAIYTLLGLVYQKFPTTCPTTNQIERHHALFKDHHEWRGCRKPHHVRAWFFSWIAQTFFPTWVRRLLTRLTRRINPKVIIWAVILSLLPHLTVNPRDHQTQETKRADLETA